MRKSILRAVAVLALVTLLALLVVAQGNWVRKADAPVSGGYGEAVVGTGFYIYVAKCLNASEAPEFWRYDPDADSWGSMSVTGLPTGAFRNGTALAWDQGDYIYALLGARYSDDRRLFYCYRISTNSWEPLTDTPHAQGAGDALAWSGYDNKLYNKRSNRHGTGFARYDTSTGSWETLTLNPSWDVTDDGASLVWMGGKYLYALRGEHSEVVPNGDFARYNIPTGAWENLQPIPLRVKV